MRSLKVTRDVLVDGGFLLLLGAIASIGFRDTFHGASYLVAALLGLVLGIALAHLSNALGRPVVLLVVFTLAAFFLLGGAIALHTDGLSAMLPLPPTLRQLADASVHGWKDLLTTLAPVDNGPLLTLPYLMALVAGAAGMALAGRTRSVAWPLVAPFAYLAGVILLGIQTPSRAVLLGACFGIVALGWVAARARRRRHSVRGTRWVQRATALLLVAAAGAVAAVVGPRLPGMGHQRIVLRSYVTPKFDVGQYPSPLASFRKYTRDYVAKNPSNKLYDQTVLQVSGLPEGTLLRFAALDDYNGDVWAATDQAPGTTGAAGAFQRVGSVIRETAPGRSYTAHVIVEAPYADQVWLPTAGTLTQVSFTDHDAKTQSGEFRFNLATQTGVVPSGLNTGDSYDFTALVSDAEAGKTLTPSTSGVSTDTSGVDFAPVAARWGGSQGSAMQQLMTIAAYLRDHGTYTDGGEGETQHAAGHSVSNLSKFSAEGVDPAGDDEQYAATMALLATRLGLPARAVVGAIVPSDSRNKPVDIKGADVHAWIELRDSAGEWLPLPTDAFMSHARPPNDAPPSAKAPVAAQAVPPPAPVRPESASGDPLASAINHRAKPRTHHQHAVHLPGWLVALVEYVALGLGLIALLVGSIVGAKAWRRRRRRTRGSPAHRLANAWRELVDQARDFGHAVAGHTTRREQAGLIGLAGFTSLAREADRRVFGAPEPTDADAATYWSEVDRMRSELSHARSPWRRVQAALSLRSFRKPPKEARA